jgi:hypothetical protein
VVEQLPSECGALSSNSSAAKKKKKDKRKQITTPKFLLCTRIYIKHNLSQDKFNQQVYLDLQEF